jgi:hypothetical protein
VVNRFVVVSVEEHQVSAAQHRVRHHLVGGASPDFSNFVWCIGAKNQRKILCRSDFSLILERADADRVYAAPVRI